MHESERYAQTEGRLAQLFSQEPKQVDLNDGSGVIVRSFGFSSRNWDVHPADDYADADPTFQALIGYYLAQSPFSDRHFAGGLQSHDREVAENRRFRYSVFLPGGRTRFEHAILLLHGLNERSWRKYLPWARELAARTHKPVILFPIAFHINRAPAGWANPREMAGVSRERKHLFPGLRGSSFMNAALSHRVQFAPHRFVTSGLQSYYDVRDLAGAIHAGRHELFAAKTQLDLFGYSIGASLAQWLLLTGAVPDSLFSKSTAFLFCGAGVLNRAAPVSKAIIDEEAFRGLVRFFERFATDPAETIPWSRHGETASIGDTAEARVLASLLFSHHRAAYREDLMRRVAGRTQLVTLAKDEVFHPEGVHRSWSDAAGTPIVSPTTLDADLTYSHEQPFPTAVRSDREHAETERLFAEVFDRAVAHLSEDTE